MFEVENFARSNINPKTSQIRTPGHHLLSQSDNSPCHPRVGGDPIKWLIKMDSRLRGNDGDWEFYINLSQFGFMQSSQAKDLPKVIAA